MVEHVKCVRELKNFTSSFETAVVIKALGASLWRHIDSDIKNLVVGKLVITHFSHETDQKHEPFCII